MNDLRTNRSLIVLLLVTVERSSILYFRNLTYSTMSLATLAASFTTLETQKNNITAAVSELEALKASNIEGQLSFVVSSVNGNVTDVVNLTVDPSEANISLAKLKNLAVGKVTELQLTTKEVVIGVTCSVPGDEEGVAAVDYTANFEVKEVGDNESLTTELELVAESLTLKVHITVTYDTVDGLLASKLLQLKEIEGMKAEVVEQIKKIKSKGGAKKEKKSKKSGAQAPIEDSSAAFDVAAEETSAFTSAVATVTEVGMRGLQLGLAHRAVLLFGAAAWAIATMGEYTSI